MNVAERRQRRQRIAQRAQQLRATRRQNRQAAAQARFVSPYTPRQAKKVARSQAQLEFGPTARQLQSEIRGSANREGELGQWYTGEQQQYATGAQQAQQAFTTAEQATNQRLTEASKSAQGTLQQLGTEDSKFANLVGGPKNSAGLAQAAEAAAAAERLRATLQAPITAMRASNVASYAPRQNAAALGGIEARREEHTRGLKERQDLQALQREKGASTVKNLQALREQDQTYTTQQRALGVKSNYNAAIEKQSKLGLKGTQITAAAQVAAAQAYSHAKERGASAQEAAAQAYAAAQRRGASAQEATAAANLAAAKVKAHSNVAVATQQGKNAASGGGGIGVREALGFIREHFGSGQRVSSAQLVDYLVNRGVSAATARKAVRRLAGGGR